jgi:hypothetical protein
MTQIEIDSHFNKIRCLYGSVKVNLYEDCLIYHSIPHGFNNKVKNELNALIMEHNLPLVAKSNESGNGLFADTVFVEVKK